MQFMIRSFPLLSRRAVILSVMISALSAAPGVGSQPTAGSGQGVRAPLPTETAVTQPEPSAAGDEPTSLDELLGLPGQPSPADPAAEQARQSELDRALSERDLKDAFTAALSKMAISADLLETQRNTGLGTQRIQGEILAKLDELIDIAQNMSSSSGASSGSSPRSASQSRPRGRPSAQPASSRPGQGQRADGPTESSQEIAPPARQEGDLNTVLDESRTEWGNLPQRIRDMMLQGSSGKFSSLYERLTQEYYRRLAEDAP